VANPILSGSRLLADTQAIPQVLAALLPEAEREIGAKLCDIAPGDVRLLVLSGSGDLYHAALSTQLAVERLTGITTLALPSMRTSLYQSYALAQDCLVVQMSFSGITARAVEAATLVKKQGASLWAFTADGGSPLAALADRCILKPDTGENEAVGFQITMVMLLLIGIGLAERLGRVRPAQSAAIRALLSSSPADMTRTLALSAPAAKAFAASIEDAPHVLFLGSGPTWGTAVNATARVMEASGTSASAQDIEEWVHLDRWIADKRLPVVLLAPPGPGSDRALEVARALKTLRKVFAVVTDETHSDRFSSLCPVLPVSTNLPEELAPLVYNLPCELLADHLCGVRNRIPYRSDDPTYAELGEIRWGGHIRTELPSGFL